jgi:transposase
MMSTSRRSEYRSSVLFVSLELGLRTWFLTFGWELGGKVWRRSVRARDGKGVVREIAGAKKHFGLVEKCRVVSLYEAGRDGFWLHRFLEASGVESHVGDASSIEVPRRKRRAKTDRVDGEKLLSLLMRRELGEGRVFGEVRVPGEGDEDFRQLQRELQSLKTERTRLSNRIQSLLYGQGIELGVSKRFEEDLALVRRWDGSELGEHLVRRLLREYRRWQAVCAQVREVEAERRALLRHGTGEAVEKVRRLMELRGVGANGGLLLGSELFGWRRFRNRRELGGLSGLCPTPSASGESSRELGISKAGSRWVRSTMVELAWAWTRFQPESELSVWFERRFARGGRRQRKVGIVALARKLLIALWRWVEQGVLPEGAVLKEDALAGI